MDVKSVSVRKALGLFLAITVTGVVALTLLFVLTRPRIAWNQQQAMLDSVSHVIGNRPFDAQSLAHPIYLQNALYFGTSEKIPVYILRDQGKVFAWVFYVVAPDGYNGQLLLAVGLDTQGKILGVRIISHHETPGLGDFFEKNDNAWLKQFIGKDIHAHWELRKSGGEFDAWTGATITPRAIVKATKQVIRYYQHFEKTLKELSADDVS